MITFAGSSNALAGRDCGKIVPCARFGLELDPRRETEGEGRTVTLVLRTLDGTNGRRFAPLPGGFAWLLPGIFISWAARFPVDVTRVRTEDAHAPGNA